MNYLELCQRLREKVGGAGNIPTSVVGQKGEALRYVNWINEAWLEIQRSRTDWRWMHKTVAVNLVPGVMAYSAADLGIANLGSWEVADVKLYDAGVEDEGYLSPADYDLFKRKYEVGAQVQGRPIEVSIDAENRLVFGTVPDKAYTVTLDYAQRPYDLVDNADIPDMPTEFHMAIVYLAMQYVGKFENAPEVVQDGSTQYYNIIERMEVQQLPPLLNAYAMV